MAKIENDHEYQQYRWERILPLGYVGQHSFLDYQEVLFTLYPNTEYPLKMLDAGCGNAAISCRICLDFTNIFLTGFDISIDNVIKARQKARNLGIDDRAMFVIGDIDKMPLSLREYWHSVISLDVLQYSKNLKKCISFLLERWNRQGPVFISLWGVDERESELAKEWGFSDSCSISTIKRILDEIGEKKLRIQLHREQFGKTCESSFQGLIETKKYYVKRWGRLAYKARYRLEQKMITAAHAGLIYHILLTSKKNEG